MGRSLRFRPAFGAAFALWILFATLATAAGSLEARTQCYDGVYVILARGTSETQGQSMVEGTVSAIKGNISESGSNEVVYPASTGSTFASSVGTGITNAQLQISEYAASCPNGKMVIMGYSQGALVMSAALAGTNYSGLSFDPILMTVGKNSKSWNLNDHSGLGV